MNSADKMMDKFAANNGIAPPVDRREWPDLADQPLPDFPLDALPDDFNAYCRAVGKSLQAPEGMVAAFGIGVVSAAIVGRVKIFPKQDERSTYSEAGQLFVFCEGESGERKSPVLKQVMQPLAEYLLDRRKETKQKNRHSVNKIEILKKQLAREKNAEKAATIADEIDEITETLIPDPENIVGDVTVEGLAQVMRAHDGRGIVLDSEANFLNVLTGKSYQRNGGAVNIDCVLKGYGDESYGGDRVATGAWDMPRVSLAVCLGVQPELLADFCQAHDIKSRGLQGRGLYFRNESKIGTRTSRGGTLAPHHMEWWAKTIRRIADAARSQQALSIGFDPYAETAYRAFCDAIEPRMKTDLCGPMAEWSGKLCGNTVRLAAIFALIDGNDQVTRRNWDAAETIMQKYLIPCARSLFVGDDPYLSEEAKALLPDIRELDSFKEGDIWRSKARYRFREARDVYTSVLTNLEQRGYIRKAIPKEVKNTRGLKPGPVWEVNPCLHKKTVLTFANEVTLE